VGCAGFQRRKLLRRLQEVDRRPDEAWALLERVQTHTRSADARERLAHLMRVTTAVTASLRAEAAAPASSAPQRLSPACKAKRTRQLAKAARRTGRLGAEAYTGAERVACRHEEWAVGQRCPVCGQGTLDGLPAGVEGRLDGQALLRAIRYELAKLRCSACGAMLTAGLPGGVGEETYSAQARAVLAVSRYDLGVPGYRWPGAQARLGGQSPMRRSGTRVSR
jgi:hypothetical protein